jgi:hypothetical protein
MKKDLLISAAVAVVAGLVAGGILLAAHPVAQVAGDFPGGITPSQLFTANSATNSVSPISGLPNLLVSGAISAGGVTANNQIPLIYTAVATYPWTPSSTSAVTIASSSFTAAQTSTQIAFNASGFAIGDPCVAQISGTTSTLFTTGSVTAVSGGAVTSTVTILNATGATVTLTVTSTVTGVTSTIKTTCFATGV